MAKKQRKQANKNLFLISIYVPDNLFLLHDFTEKNPGSIKAYLSIMMNKSSYCNLHHRYNCI